MSLCQGRSGHGTSRRAFATGPLVTSNPRPAPGACQLVTQTKAPETSGGPGPAASDVTPEATLDVVDKVLPGFGEQMRSISLAYVPTAILSRQTAGIRGSTLIVNLPGQPKAISEILDELFASIPYCIELLGGPLVSTNTAIVSAFRPSSAPPVRAEDP